MSDVEYIELSGYASDGRRVVFARYDCPGDYASQISTARFALLQAQTLNGLYCADVARYGPDDVQRPWLLYVVLEGTIVYDAPALMARIMVNWLRRTFQGQA